MISSLNNLGSGFVRKKQQTAPYIPMCAALNLPSVFCASHMHK